MKIAIGLLIFFLSSPPANSFAAGWELMTLDFTTTGTEVTPTQKWVVLESFATAAQCNDRRSSLIKEIDKARRALGDAGDHGRADETERELKLLWYIYTHSKCVAPRQPGN